MFVCGLDIATTSGWSIYGAGPIRAGKFTAKGSSDGAVFRSFRTWLRAFLVAEGVTDVAFEEPLRSDLTKTTVINPGQDEAFGRRAFKTKTPITNMSTLRRLYGLAAIVLEVCAELSIPVEEVNQRAWRSVFIGSVSPPKGTKDRTGWWKEQALAQARRLGLTITSKDAADAVGVGFYLHQKLTGSALPGDLFHHAAE